MANKVQELTVAGRDALKKELEERKNVTAEEIKKRLSYARSQGDLSENADYSAAREDQSFNETRIQEIEEILKYAKIIEKTDVKVLYLHNNKEVSLSIVGSAEANPFEGKISTESPLAKAIEGKNVGETFTFTSETGKDFRVTLLDYKKE